MQQDQNIEKSSIIILFQILFLCEHLFEGEVFLLQISTILIAINETKIKTTFAHIYQIL